MLINCVYNQMINDVNEMYFSIFISVIIFQMGLLHSLFLLQFFPLLLFDVNCHRILISVHNLFVRRSQVTIQDSIFFMSTVPII